MSLVMVSLATRSFLLQDGASIAQRNNSLFLREKQHICVADSHSLLQWGGNPAAPAAGTSLTTQRPCQLVRRHTNTIAKSGTCKFVLAFQPTSRRPHDPGSGGFLNIMAAGPHAPLPRPLRTEFID